MFLRTYGYSLLRSVRQKEILFWSILFPIILGTLFKVSFGDINKTENMFHQIPVAYVEGEEPQQEFEVLLEELEEENELVKIIPLEEQEAEKKLEDGKVDGIFRNDGEITLVVTEEGIETSILKSIQEQYEQTVRAFTNIATEHPEKLETVAQTLGEQWNYLKEDNITNQELDIFMDCFYALIAMNCLYACFAGVICAVEFKADLSHLAARRVVASTNHLAILLAEIFAKITVQSLCTIIGACYLQYALKVNLGDEIGRIFLVILVGNIIGVMTGVFVGSIGKLKEHVKEGICIGVTMFGCFLAGLMGGGMYPLIERTVPVINRINPATLIVRALYSLNIYENYTKYNQCIFTLLGIAVLLCAGSYLMVRRERYASI